MIKYSLLLLLLFFYGCLTVSKQITPVQYVEFSLKADIQRSIIDGFFDGDSANIPDNIYYLN
jgi:hypothetical protein